MTSRLRILLAAAAAALAAGSASAQNATAPAPAPAAQTPATTNSGVGPDQLRDFTLNGTVTRPAEPRATAPAPARPAPSAAPPSPRPSATTALPPARSAAPAPSAVPTQRSTTVDLPPAETTAPGNGVGIVLPEPTVGAEPSLTGDAAAPAGGWGLLPWLLAAALVGAAGAFYWLRVRPRAQLAGAEGFDAFAAPEPAPAPPPPPPPAPAPEARPRPAPAAGGGIVSTRLRPWIEIDLIPERAIVEEGRVAVEYVVALYNSGGGPAADVRVEAALINASAAQDQQIAAFFARASGRGDRFDRIDPLQRVTARSVIAVPRDQFRPLFAEGRPLLVPMLALNVIYRWGSNSAGQTSASYLVGKQTSGDKLAPFRLDIGPRVFRGLVARAHRLGVRD